MCSEAGVVRWESTKNSVVKSSTQAQCSRYRTGAESVAFSCARSGGTGGQNPLFIRVGLKNTKYYFPANLLWGWYHYTVSSCVHWLVG